jgi:large subunit ribosomal protein L25
MSENILKAQHRQEGGKGAARQLRLKDRVPGVFYHQNKINLPFSVDAQDLSKLMRHRHTLISLEIDGQSPMDCIIRELQRNPVNEKIIHLDLLGVKSGEKLHLSVPVKLVGLAIGVKSSGGILEHGLAELEIECLPSDIPEVIEVDVSGLDIGHGIHISDLTFPALRFLDDPKSLVATIVPPTIEKVKTVEAAEEEVVQEESKEKGEG